MWELLWKLGILSVVLIFGIKIGLAMGFAGISRKLAALIILGYGGGLLILTQIVTNYVDQIQGFVYAYSPIIALMTAVIILYAGFHTINEWKLHHRDQATATCMAMIAPCPCCFASAVAAIILMSPVIGVSAFYIGQYAAITLSVTMIVCYLASGLIVKLLNKPYAVILGNFMLFTGFYFLISAILIPNISSVLSSKMTPLEIPSTITLTVTLLGVVVLMAVGVIITRNKSIISKN
jgi:predicted transporter